ncbi:hypothetical protein Rfer_4248 (plasmid) [Rhodoferax ferrireducens T118]|uniref:Type II secretion system protein GspC N-terminal domain-containing protein n=1 Tax=Albidiferax ferrireducens (strain ATCC BAA-621 / DSM 15236 / T118) TaxID=338969 RepID=Q21QL0_ALBFT|nr:hypothetical protein [Rhodoferax ferrireducens]ABD71935.1 hypothetical protein Rfer_4248 [Rhodoferax ferrireducens T118]
MKKQVLVTALLLASMHVVWAQSAPATPAVTGDTVESAVDTIEERANQARLAERAKTTPQTTPMAPQLQMPAPTRAKTPVAEYALIGLRGWANSLEATVLVNGKRATGSMKYPTLTDGWRLLEITQGGAVIVKGKERRELAFIGPEPYELPKPAAVGVGGKTPLPSGMPVLPAR